jgi:hypothetical protein
MREELRLSLVQLYEEFVRQDKIRVAGYSIAALMAPDEPPPPPPPEKRELHVDVQTLGVLNTSAGGLRPYLSLDTQVSLPLKDWSPFPTLKLGPTETAFVHEPALGVTESVHVNDPSESSKVTGHTQVSAQIDIIDIGFKKKLDEKTSRDILELKVTAAYQYDIYSNASQGQVQFGLEGHVTPKRVSVVIQAQVPFNTQGTLPPSYAGGLLVHF